MRTPFKFAGVVLIFLLPVAAAALAGQPAVLPELPKTAGTIAGKVTDESGSPIAGARAEAFSCADETASGSAVTDNTGQFLIGPIKNSCYKVRFDRLEYESSWHGNPPLKDSAVEVSVTGDNVEGIDGQLSSAGSVITGKVKSLDGKPLAGAWVTAIRRDEKGGSISDGRTDEKGAYSVGVFPGSYFVIFARKGYVTKVHGKSTEEPTMVKAAEEETVTGIDAVLSKGGRITGKVTDEGGNALHGIYVVTTNASGKPGLPVTVRTDPGGEFILDGLAAGKYRIAFIDHEQKYQLQLYDRKSILEEGSLVTVTALGTTSGIRGILRQSGGISGRVVDAAGNAIPRVQVFSESTDRTGSGGSAITNESGEYTIAGLPSGTYRLSYRAQGGPYLPRFYRDAADQKTALPVEVTAPLVTSDIDVTLPEGNILTGSISGTGGAPIPWAMVTVYPAAKDSKATPEFATTNPDGTFSIPLPEGEYIAEFSSDGYLSQWSGGGSIRHEAKPVAISKEQGAMRLDVVLSRGGSISGTIKNRLGTGIAGVTVSAKDAATGDRGGNATSGAGGKYVIQGLKSGSFLLSAEGSAVGYMQAKLPQPVNVRVPAPTENIDFVVTPGGTVAGKVTDWEGNPLQAVEVAAYDPETWDEVGSTYTDATGAYKIGGLPEKKYRIRFQKTDSKYAVQWYKGKTRREDSVQLELTGTATIEGIDAALVTGLSLTGVVTDTAGAPLTDAVIEIYGGIEDEPFEKVYTSGNGRFTVPSLAPGNYRIRFSHPDHVPQWYGSRDRTTATSLAIKGPGIPPISAALVKASGKFSGKLTNPEGQKIGQAWITAIEVGSGFAVADERICECSGEFHTPVPSGVYQLRVERHGLVTWYGGNTREEAVPLLVRGEISGLDMVIEEKTVRRKQPPPKAPGTGE